MVLPGFEGWLAPKRHIVDHDRHDDEDDEQETEEKGNEESCYFAEGNSSLPNIVKDLAGDE